MMHVYDQEYIKGSTLCSLGMIEGATECVDSLGYQFCVEGADIPGQFMH